jgi:hypothetical protein
MQVKDQQAATEQVVRHAQTIMEATGMSAGRTPVLDAGPLPGGSDDDLEHLPDGAYNPYQIALAGRLDDIPSDQLEPAVLRARDDLGRSGWRIVGLVPAESGRDATELTGLTPGDEHTFRLEALHDLNRLVLSVTSPPYRHPV